MPNSRRTTVRKPGDLTGHEHDANLKEAAETQAARANELTMITAIREEKLSNTVLDTEGNEVSEIDLEQVTAVPEKVNEVIRVIEDAEFFMGAEFYTFKVGQRYKVPKHVADHLEEKGYLWRASN